MAKKRRETGDPIFAAEMAAIAEEHRRRWLERPPGDGLLVTNEGRKPPSETRWGNASAIYGKDIDWRVRQSRLEPRGSDNQ